MRRILAFLLIFLAVILCLSSGFGPKTLDSEKVFDAGLHNSLYYLDQAKHQWAEEKNKSELDTPTLADIMPYMGDWKDAFPKFKALGIEYTITSMAENQSDIATLTRELRFSNGICRFYPAGTSLCLHGLPTWDFPRLSGVSRLRSRYFQDLFLLEAAVCFLAVVNLLVLAINRIRSRGRRASTAYQHDA